MALVTAAEIRAHLKGLNSTDDDTVLGTLIDRFEAVLSAWCGYPPASATASASMASTSYTLYLTGQGGRDLWLPLRPVTAIASVYDDPDGDWGATTLVSSGDYALFYDPARGQSIRLTSTATHGTWSSSPRAIKVALTCGYSTAPQPYRLAVEAAVRNLYTLRGHSGLTSESGNKGNFSYTDEELFPEEVQRLAAPLRLPSVAVGGL